MTEQLTEPITISDLVELGFEAEVLGKHLNDPAPSGIWFLPGWEPVPKVDHRDPVRSWASVGSQQRSIKSRADLEVWIQKVVPTFSDLK
jgi:hypothetical protein